MDILLRSSLLIAAVGVCLSPAATIPPPGACPGSLPLASFRLSALPPSSSAPSSNGADPTQGVPLRALTRLDAGARIAFSPHELYGAAGSDAGPAGDDDAQVALITIPTTPTGVLGVLEAHKASQPAEWVIPSRAAAVALVFGPQGLKLSTLADLMRRDPQLIPQLAVYAETSAQTELLMETVARWERNGGGGAGGAGADPNLQAALQGLSSRAGVTFPVLNRNAPPDQQALTLMRALHPALSTLDPLAPSPAQRMQQSAGLAAAVAGLFFGNTVGVASAGGAMFLNLRSLFFPGSEFRSALGHQSAASPAAPLVLCSKREPAKSRTRPIYLWATRIQGAPAPRFDELPYRANLAAATAPATPPREQEILVPLKGSNFASVASWAVERGNGEVKEPPLPARYLAESSTLAITLPAGVRKGEKLQLRLALEDSPAPLVIPSAIEILNPRPSIAALHSALPQEFSVPLLPGELPANSYAALTIRTAALVQSPAVHLACAPAAGGGDDAGPTAAAAAAPQPKTLSIRPGEPNSGTARLRPAGPGAWYLAFEPGAVGQPPCTIAARIETSDGLSDPVEAGRLVRLPRIEKFSLTPELAASSAAASATAFTGWIEGEELEGIEQTGWDERRGLPVQDAPVPIASHASRQRLRIAMPWPPPSPRAALYVWLRGESAGRRTTATY